MFKHVKHNHRNDYLHSKHIHPLYTDGFSNTDQYNKDGIVHYIF